MCRSDATKVIVGSSAREFVGGQLIEGAIEQQVTSGVPTRVREARSVIAEKLQLSDNAKQFIDDVAVSGTTLAAARLAAGPNSDDSALVGLAFDSKRLRKNAGMPIEIAVLYRQEGGGRPAVNSLSTLACRPELRRDYALRKFGREDALDECINIYLQEDN